MSDADIDALFESGAVTQGTGYLVIHGLLDAEIVQLMLCG